MRALTILGMGALVVACVLRRDALVEAVATVPVAALLALAGLHFVSLVARSEAWRLSLAVSGGAGALAAGLALSATSIFAVLIYAGLLALRGNRAEVRLQAVGVEGAEAIEARVVGAVEVGRTSREEAVLAAALDDDARADGVMGRVEGLDAVDPELDEAVDRVEDGLGVGHVPERVRPDGDAAGLVDGIDRLGDGRGRAGAVGGRAGDEIGLEKLRGVHDPLALEAHPVGRMIKGGLSEMRTADRGALRQVEGQPAGAQGLGHLDRAAGAVGAERGERVAQRGGVVVDQV